MCSSNLHDRLGAFGWRHTVLAPGAHGPGCIDCGGLLLPGTGGYRFVLRRGRAQRQIEAAAPDMVEAADPYVLAWSALAAAERLKVPAVAFCHSHLPALAARLAGGTNTGRGPQPTTRNSIGTADSLSAARLSIERSSARVTLHATVRASVTSTGQIGRAHV